jgi:3-methylfumaryl-CoA hydratase
VEAYLGRQRREIDEVAPGQMRRLAAMLDQDPAAIAAGGALPPGWHAVLFPPLERQGTLGRDGHPERDSFLPPYPLPRRMMAGRRVAYGASLRIGDSVERLSTIRRIEPRQGRSGALVFVTIEHRITGPAGLAVTESQEIVYRAAPVAAPGQGTEGQGSEGQGSEGQRSGGQPEIAPAPAAPVSVAPWERSLVVDSVLLFRYSALTFNGHRIHYDAPYAREVEHYPALVVNGGLTTLLLVEFARTRLRAPIVAYRARALRPLYVDRPIALRGEPMQGGAALWALDDQGGVAFRVEVETAPHETAPMRPAP